ncbi:MAG: hypothetical protein AAF581_16010 [Planctomycetota bacterium]
MFRSLMSSVVVIAGIFAGAQVDAQSNPDFRVLFQNDEITYDVATGIGETNLGLWIHEQPGTTGSPTNVQGWSLSLGIDPSKVTVNSVVAGAYVATVNNGSLPDFFSINTNVAGFTAGAVYNFFGNVQCIYDVPKEALVADLSTVPSAYVNNATGDTVPLVWTMLGNPPVENQFVITGGASIPSNAVNGTLDVVPAGGGFLRGDTDGDGSLSAITDAVWLLAYLFNSGPLDCFDAGDVNDDGSINLPDPIQILSWGFNQGPAPMAPYPLCGPDPSMDALDCATPPAVCP